MSKFKARLYKKMKESKMTPKLDLPVIIGRLQSLKRLDGMYVKWQDIQELIEELKTDNTI